MDFEIVYTQPALDDLSEVLAWSWENHPDSTERFMTGLLQHMELLKNFHRLGRPVKGFREVRQLLHSPLHIYYRVIADSRQLEILHIWHGSRRPPIL